MQKKKLVVLTGAGISAESGIQTFRDSGGLWEGYKIEEVATPEAWQRNPEQVQEFYNLRRKAVLDADPNEAHRAIVSLEEHFEVSVITQNIDNLHERAGSSSILHLHGEIVLARSTVDETKIYPIKGAILKMTDTCSFGLPLRPHIVWFGEQVPMMIPASKIVSEADILVIIGTSMVVYPAAGLIKYTNPGIPVFVVDPNRPAGIMNRNVVFIEEKATTGMQKLIALLGKLQ